MIRDATYVLDGLLDNETEQFRMLQALMSQPGRVYSRESLMKSSYLDDRIVSDCTIDSHIKNLGPQGYLWVKTEQI